LILFLKYSYLKKKSVCIPKADYEKFAKYGVKELPEDIFFQTEETDRHWEILPFSGLLGNLRDTRRCYGCGSSCKHKDGLQLDMFQGHPTSIFGKYLFGRRFEI